MMAGNFSFRGKGLRFPNGIPRTTAESGNNANGLRTRIADVIVKHHTDCDDTVDGTWTQCECDAGWRREDEWAVHVADAVIEALNLRTDQVGTLTRYVTEWIDNG